MFLTVSALQTHISTCGTAASRAYNSFIQLRYCTSTFSALPSISPAALFSRSSTLVQSLFSIRFLFKARVYYFLYRCFCCLSLSLLSLASSFLRLRLPSSSLLSLSVGLISWEQEPCSYQGRRKISGEVRQWPLRPASAAHWSARDLTILRAAALCDFFERSMLAMDISVISKSKSQIG